MIRQGASSLNRIDGQIELNRALYVDEATSRPKDGDFEKLAEICHALVAELGKL